MTIRRVPRLADADLKAELPKKTYKETKDYLQSELVRTQLDLFHAKVPVVLVFEGWDAAGKGGSIRRLLEHIDPRAYRVHSTAAPTADELAHHYLWRFWTRLPERGKIAVFDRSWYGRVLVERIERFAAEREWRRSYDEINEFERQLSDDGHLILKFFMHISKDEQKRRFESRAQDPLKAWKLTDEDWRNRRKWNPYVTATDEMMAKTHLPHAPWHVVPANDKRLARLTVMRICVDAFGKALKLKKQ